MEAVKLGHSIFYWDNLNSFKFFDNRIHHKVRSVDFTMNYVLDDDLNGLLLFCLIIHCFVINNNKNINQNFSAITLYMND